MRNFIKAEQAGGGGGTSPGSSSVYRIWTEQVPKCPLYRLRTGDLMSCTSIAHQKASVNNILLNHADRTDYGPPVPADMMAAINLILPYSHPNKTGFTRCGLKTLR